MKPETACDPKNLERRKAQHFLQLDDIDALAENVMHQVMAPGGSARSVAGLLVIRMAQHHPTAPALSPVLILAIVAHGIEGLLAEADAPSSTSGDLWRMATLLAADVLLLEAERKASVCELLDHWHNSDNFFLK
jgi:hypothetical protein